VKNKGGYPQKKRIKGPNERSPLSFYDDDEDKKGKRIRKANESEEIKNKIKILKYIKKRYRRKAKGLWGVNESN